MSEMSGGPPSEGWYAIGGDPNDLAYFDGQYWTWRGRRDAVGGWQQEPIVPPSLTAPTGTTSASHAPPPAGSDAPPPAGSQPPPATGSHVGSPAPFSQLPSYPSGPSYGSAGADQWAPPPSPRPPGRLDLLLPEPGHQARWKTLFRALLVIPNFVVLFLLEIAQAFVTIAMWFVALFTAQVPPSLWEFSTSVLKWNARTNAFTYFLTDRYPPFRLGDADFPVSVSVGGPPDRFNRFSVLFRVVLLIPAWIVVVVFTEGVGVFSIVAWLLTLIMGRCPRPMYLVNAAWLRYTLRFYAFAFLLTTEYPSRPLGDPPLDYGPASLENGDIVLAGGAKALGVIEIVVGVIAYFGLPKHY